MVMPRDWVTVTRSPLVRPPTAVKSMFSKLRLLTLRSVRSLNTAGAPGLAEVTVTSPANLRPGLRVPSSSTVP